MKTMFTTVVLLVSAMVAAQIPDNNQKDREHIQSDEDVFYTNPETFDYFFADDWDSEPDMVSIELFPVPVQDYLTIRISCSCTINNVRITVLDHEGFQVFGMRGESMEAGDKRLIIPFNDLPIGTYYVWIQHEDGMLTRKIVKQ